MSTALKLFSALVLVFTLASAQSADKKKSRLIENEIERVKKMSEDPHLTTAVWVTYTQEIDNRCGQEAEKKGPDTEELCSYFYSIFQIGNLFTKHPTKRTNEICDQYIRKQEISQDERVQKFLETIVEKLCLKQ